MIWVPVACCLDRPCHAWRSRGDGNIDDIYLGARYLSTALIVLDVLDVAEETAIEATWVLDTCCLDRAYHD